MCKVKTGRQIESLNDIQNVVTASILRAQAPFSLSSLSSLVVDSCKGSLVPVTDLLIKSMVKETTNALLRSNYITTKSGLYYARPIA